MRVFNISLCFQNKNIRYERAARDISSGPVAISPFTVIHFTPQRWQPDVTSRAIKIFIKILWLTCNWTIAQHGTASVGRA